MSRRALFFGMRLAALACFACTGCIAFSVRGHVDAVSDLDEHHGVQTGINVGFGYAGEKSALLASVGAESGTAPTFGVRNSIDYVHVPANQIGWRAGVGGELNIVGDPSIAGLRVAMLYSLREKAGYHQSSDDEQAASLLALSLEATLGLGASAGVGLELYSLSRPWL